MAAALKSIDEQRMRPTSVGPGKQELQFSDRYTYERAAYLLVCRRCEAPSCIAACAFEALERREDGVLERHNLRCVSCMACAQACPFGTILPDMLPFYDTPCDPCLEAAGAEEPPCVSSCLHGGLEYREIGPDEPSVHIVDERLAARARKWEKREPPRGRTA